MSEAEIIEFANRYDPQLIHTDPSFAARGPFGGLIASGWQTAGWMMRLFADNFLPRTAAIASPGVDELRWKLPVRPGNASNPRERSRCAPVAIEARPRCREHADGSAKSEQRSCAEPQGHEPYALPKN